MLTPEDAATLVGQYGLWVLAPAAVLEGPIVTVVSVWLARLGMLDLRVVLLMLVLADLLGDVLFYALGRGLLPRLPRALRHRFGLHEARLAALGGHFRDNGPRTLVLGKLTHSAGAVVLVAAGMARMHIGRFLWWNLLATLPKTAGFAVLGWVLGDAYVLIGDWLAVISGAGLAILLAAGGLWHVWRRRVSA